MYLPFNAARPLADGQMPSTDVDTIAAAGRTFLHSAWSSNGILPVVWDRNRHSALSVTSIEVDSVPDVIRRRRPATTNYRAVLTS
jgi:hypothetical protein